VRGEKSKIAEQLTDLKTYDQQAFPREPNRLLRELQLNHKGVLPNPIADECRPPVTRSEEAGGSLGPVNS
jgi:hypothetical protein